MTATATGLDEDTTTTDGVPSTGTSRWQQVIGVLGLAAVLWAGSNLYDAISRSGGGPGDRGPVMDAPGDDRQPVSGTDGGGAHVPGPPAGGH